MSLPVQLGGPAPFTASVGFKDAGTVLNDAAIELGISDELEDPMASSDPNFIQMKRLLKNIGGKLVRLKQWTHLIKTATITTIQGTPSYDLPEDFSRMVDQTAWNRTQMQSIGDPVTSQGWQAAKAIQEAVVTTVFLRQQQQQIWLYPDTNTPGGQTIAYEYVSRWWVKPNGQSMATSDTPDASSDVLWFDPLLLVYALKLAFLRAKGFDSAGAQQDYDEILKLVMAQDSMAPVLRLGAPEEERLIDGANLPTSGWGL